MKRIALVLMVAAIAVTPCCGNDPRIVDAKMAGGSDGSGSAAVCNGSNSEWLQNCSDSSTCNGCTCKPFGHDMYCTKSCTVPADCPAPATMCFNGFCAK